MTDQSDVTKPRDEMTSAPQDASDPVIASERGSQGPAMGIHDRAPRVWNAGDAEPPADVTLLRYEDAEMPYPYLRRIGAGWGLETSEDPTTWTSDHGWRWDRIAAECKFNGPLVEVLPGQTRADRAAGDENGTEADVPSMPNFWWSPTNHLYRGGTERPCADAVKLGDVERAEAKLAGKDGYIAMLRRQRNTAEAERDALRADIRAVLADFYHCGPRLPTTMLQQINDIVEREPPSPLPADETERPQRCPARVPEGNVITEGRQCQQNEGHAHDHTWYGDNECAYSAWSNSAVQSADEGEAK